MNTPSMPPPPPPPRSSGPPKPPLPPLAIAARAEATFDSALSRPSEERAAYLRQECGEDDALHAEVMALLHAHDAAAGFM